MKLAFIGMSGVGKTAWSKKLANRGWKRFSCDGYIEMRMADILVPLGLAGIGDVAKWMGQPYEQQYAKNCAKYLQLENESVQKALRMANSTSDGDNLVIDTTGSFIYLPKESIEQLKHHVKLVYFATSKKHENELLRRYIAHPKPVVWGDSFTQRPGEDSQSALRRSYPHLLAYRTQRYAALADVTISADVLSQKSFDLVSFLTTRV